MSVTHQPYHPKSLLPESSPFSEPHFPHLKNKENGTGEMAQQLRVHVAFAEDLGLILSTSMAAHNHNPSSRESTAIHVLHIYACWQNIYTHGININKL